MSINEIVSKIEKECDIVVNNFSKIDEGANYDIYKLETDKKTYTLRHQVRAMFNSAPLETEILTQLNGYYAPRLHFYKENFCADAPVMLLDYIDGDIPIITDPIIQKVINQAEEIHNKFRQKSKFVTKSEYLIEIFNEKFPRIYTKLDNNPYVSAYELAPHLEKLRAKIIKYSHIRVEEECLLHLDLHSKNLLINGDSLTFIDWELARYSIEELEFAGILFSFGRKTKADFTRVLQMIPKDKQELSELAYQLKLCDVVVWRAEWCNQNRNHENCELFLEELKEEMKQIEGF